MVLVLCYYAFAWLLSQFQCSWSHPLVPPLPQLAPLDLWDFPHSIDLQSMISISPESIFHLSIWFHLCPWWWYTGSTPWAIKTCHFIWDHNSHVSWWIFTLLAPMKTGKILYRGITKFATLPQLCLYTTWENLKTHTTAHFETSCQCILMLTVINGKNESKWTVFRVCAQNVHLFSHTGCQTISPLVDSMSMICCSSSFQTVSRRCRISSVFWITECASGRAMWHNYDVNRSVEYLFLFRWYTNCRNPSKRGSYSPK